jgi:hypothetical protein
MNPILKYTLARILLFAVCVGLVSLPADMNLFLKLLVALIVSSAASFFLLRRWRDEVAERLSMNSRRRLDEKERLRAALSGDDEPASGGGAPGR